MRLLFILFSGLWILPGILQNAQANTRARIEEGLANPRLSCKTDIEKLCKNIAEGSGKTFICLSSNDDQLSPACHKAIATAKASAADSLEVSGHSFRKNCGSDAQKYCSPFSGGRGNILDCLEYHQDSLSNSCKTLDAQVDEKLAELMG